MRVLLGLVFGGVSIAGLGFALSSCGSTNQCSGFDCNANTPDGSTGDESIVDLDAPDPFGDTGPGKDSSNCSVGCSGDLHNVVDCNGNVVLACPPDKGCAPGGTCVDACDAAKQNKSSVGCEYFALSATDFTGQTCFAAFVANTWGSPVTVAVERGGAPLTGIAYAPQGGDKNLTYAPLANNTIPTGGVGILFLSDDGASCPAGVNVGVKGGVGTAGTAKSQAFHITTNAPVVAYDIFPYGGGSSAVTGATLLLPTSAWDDNYVTTSTWSETGFGNPWIAVTAMEDNTSFTISPTAAIVGGTGVAAAAKGVPTTYTLNKGQFVRFHQPTDLSGSVVKATKPVGSWGGHGCTNLEQPACDGMHQQIPPVKALGHEYVAVRYRNRLAGFDETPPWRIVGAVDGTTLTFDPPITGAPTTLASGQVIELNANAGTVKGPPFTIKSQDDKHPFFLGGHMTGCFTLPGNYGSPVGCAGDPEFVNVIPPEQYLAGYTFFTDPTYPETHLVFVRKKANDQTFHDVSLDCAGKLTGWAPVGSSGNYEFTRLDLVTGNFAKVGNCDNGRHSATSDVPFGLTVWGWGSKASAGTAFSEAVSYAYPAGASVQPINTVVIPPTPK